MTTATRADGEILMAAILDNPADDLARLAFADWLEEGGQSDRVEFIRAQMEVAATGVYDCPHKKKPSDACCGFCDFCRPAAVAWQLRNRLSILAYAGPTLFPFVCSTYHWRIDRYYSSEHITLYLERGFVEAVRCPIAGWLAHGPAIVRIHPVARVEIIDRVPTRGTYGPSGTDQVWGWAYFANYYGPVMGWGLPVCLFSLLPYDACHNARPMISRCYPAEAAACDALSTACLVWAKLSKAERSSV